VGKKSKKTPKLGASPSTEKVPHRASRTDRDFILSWRFTRVDHSGKWPWRLDQKTSIELAKKMGGWETMKEGLLFGSNTGNKQIPTANLCPDAQRRLGQLKLDDIDVLWELRVTGIKRIWGLRQGGTIDILWWDPNHEVCPSSKKNT
jgi:hypothetical protein